jgi:predicted TIM-barrel fold metal-dependent hydrolase
VSEIVHGAIDTDVHVEPPSIDAIKPYLSGYWLEYIRGARSQLGNIYPPSLPTSARPEAREAGTFPPRDYETLKTQLLDPYSPRAVILNSVSAFTAGWNPYYQAAIARAVNEWMADEMLSKDDRLRASICVPLLDPVAAAAEIDRLGNDRRFVQVMLPIRSETPWGNVRWQAIHDACARNNVTMALHAWGQPGATPTVTGYARTHLMDSVSNAQLVAPPQVLSLICEGVFKRNPTLRVALQEVGFNWIHALMWRFDKDWKSLWREVPWVTDRPSEYIARNFRATTSPSHIPSWVSSDEVATMARFINASELLMYSSDYPHDHGNDGSERLFEAVGEIGRDRIFHENAEAFYDLNLVAAR